MFYDWSAHEVLEACKKTNMKILRILQTYVSKDKITLDVGACLGAMTLYLAPLSQEVHAFEPIPFYFKKLNSLGFPNVHTYNVAISNFNGSTNITEENGQGSIVWKKGNQLGQVPVRTIDSYYFDNVGFIKIDVEGSEMNVLKGAEMTIRRCKPVMLIETIQKQLDFPLIDLFTFLWDIGYKSMVYKDDILIEVTKESEIKDFFELHVEEWSTYDTLFIPK